MQKEEIGKNAVVVWQESEEAIILRRWNGCVEINQGKGSVLLEDDNAKEILKLLKEMFAREVITN